MRYADTALRGKDDSLGTWLLPRLETAELVGIRTGFLSLAAVQALGKYLPALLEREGRLEMVVGGDGDQADPEALRELFDLTADADNASVRVVMDPQEFHNAKTYYVRYADERAEAWVGSANFTHGGLLSNQEAAIALDSAVDEPGAIEEVLRGIQNYRQGQGSVPLDTGVIRQIEARRHRQRSRGVPALKATEPLGDLLLPTMEEVDAIASRDMTYGVPTGFDDVDAVLGGLHRGTLTVVASRPAVGRTTLLLNFVRTNAVEKSSCVALFSSEMAKQQVMQRILAAEARIRLSDMRSGRMSDDDWTRLAKTMTRLSEDSDQLLVNATPAPNLESLTAEIATLCSEQDVELVAIDSLSSITVPVETGASRERELAIAARRLKALALELDVPIVVTAELNRGTEQRADKKPQIGDLRDSDTIAQVADTVILIHRPDASEPDDPRMGEADLIVAKNRSGRPFTATVAHQLHYSRFVDLVEEDRTYRPYFRH